MVKILAIFGSPRRGGNTDRLLEAFLAGPAPGTIECTRVAVSETDCAPCTGCQECDREGRCVLNDGMQPVYRWIEDADLVVLASPVYFYGLTAQAKAVVDRAQAFWARKYRLGERAAGTKAGFLIAAGGSKGPRLFECVERTMKYFCDALDARFLGSLTFRSLDRMGDMDRHPEYLEQAREAGARVVAELVADCGDAQEEETHP